MVYVLFGIYVKMDLNEALISTALCAGIYEELTSVQKEYEFRCGVIDEPERFNVGEMNGRALFLQYCASCHNNTMLLDMTGPALAGVRGRWVEYEGAIYKWIRNSEKLAKEGNPRAKMMIEWSEESMPIFENLDSVQIEQILAYIEAK
jgi:cytochrome c2